AIRDIRPMTADQAAACICNDAIDILIPVGGYCYGSRPDILARQPAPIQVDLGGITSWGFPQMSYRITDELLDPPDSQPYYTEQLAYFSQGVMAFRPPEESPLVSPLPARRNGFVTFGSFNNHRKISNVTLDLWCRVLRQVSDARMVLKFPYAVDKGIVERLQEAFQQRGVSSDRLSFCGCCEYQNHLMLLGDVDLLLDTYPFNGARTTMEGLWMGVPTVTLSGETFVSRQGHSIYHALGVDAFVAKTQQDYVERACRFAGQLDSLNRIRHALRPLFLNSPVCNPEYFSREMEQILRGFWYRFCREHG
ncbi:hypothetical protein ACFL3F_05765, partial [Planctomycetota bacterium]